MEKPMKIREDKWEEVTGDWRRLHNEKLHQVLLE
jgi:hypothetical protein